MSARSAAPQPFEWTARAMSGNDLDTVARVEREIYDFPWSRGNFADSIAAGYDCWVFERERVFIGYAIVMWIPDEAHLLNLSVAAEHQGRGYGRAMLEWLCANTRGRGARALMLEVRPSNRTARALYDSMRFRQVGVRKRYYPAHGLTREDALVLVKDLDDE